MKKNFETFILDDNKEYLLVDEDTLDNTKYSFFANVDDETDICFKKTIIENNEEYFIGLDSEKEFDKVLLHFTKKNLK